MPLDLRALVDSTIEKEEKKLAKWLAAVETKQKAAEREVVEQLLFRDYVEKSVEMNPNQASVLGVWDGLRQADILQEAQQILTAKETVDPASQGTTDRSSMLGLTPSEVLPLDEAIKEFHHEVIPRVAIRIESDRDRLVKFVDPLSVGDRQRSGSVTSATPLSDTIEEKLHRLSLVKDAVTTKREKKEEFSLKLLKKYDDLLTRSLLTLQESFPIVKKHQALDMRQHLATLKTLNLKAKVTDLGLMKMVYTPERLKALKAIRHNIDMKTAEIDKECEKYSSTLRSYDSLDPEFSAVVNEFKEVLDKINVHQYILKEYGIDND